MSSTASMTAALVGAGNIAGRYATRILASDGFELAGATDVLPGRAEVFAAEHGVLAYPSLDALLADDAVDLVVRSDRATRPRGGDDGSVARPASTSTAKSRSRSGTRMRSDSSSSLAHAAFG